MTVKPRLGLTAWLAILVLGTIVPLLLFAGLTLRGILHTSRALADRGQVDTTRALALAVDGEIRSWKAALAGLAESKSARPGRWAEFYEEARQVGLQHEGWVVLTVASGEQIFNTLLPYGTALQRTSSPETINAIFREGKPIVSDVIWGKNAQRYLVAMAVPVVRAGKVVNCLTVNFSPDRLTRLLQSQQLPATWMAALSDSQGRVVARSRNAEARVGKPVPEWFATSTRASESGIVTGPMTDGRLGQIAFERLHEASWVAVLAIPVAELQSAAPIWGFLSIGAILGLLAVGVAVYMGRKMTGPVRSLARASEGLLRGETGQVGQPTGIREIQELQQALVKASTAARAHAMEREHAAEALRQANAVLEARVAERTAALASANESLLVANADLHEEMAQRRRAEESVQAVARFPSENPNPVLRLDSQGRILYANAASACLLEQWKTPVGSQAPAPWPDTVRDALTGNSGTTVELACGDRAYAVFVAPVSEAGYVNLYTADVTERKRAEEALRQLNAELSQRVSERTAELAQAVRTLERQAAQLHTLTAELTLAEQRERRRLADVLHDELQQLLVATRLRAYMLGHTADPAIQQGAQEMVALIEEALGQARSLAGELSPPALQNGSLLPALEWLIRWVREKHHLAVHLTPPPVRLPRVPEDTAVLLYQAIRECLLNTVKHAGVDEATVTVVAAAPTLTVTVADGGVGFDPTRLRVAGGTEGGVGLLGIRERLEWVGGRLEIASTPGSGSRFTMVAPLGGTAMAPATPLPAVPAEAESGSRAARRLRVLMVDDHALMRRGVATLLAGESDLEVVGEAENGQRAIELTRQLTPDIVLMDVSMPVMNGIDATRAIHAEFPMVRVIGLSMFEDPAQSEEMLQAGAVGYLRKNDSAEALLAVIRGGGATGC